VFCSPVSTPTPTVPPTPTSTVPPPTPTPTTISLSCDQCDLDQNGILEHTAPFQGDLDFMNGCLNQLASSDPCYRANLSPGGILINTGDSSAFTNLCVNIYPNQLNCSTLTPTSTPTNTPTGTILTPTPTPTSIYEPWFQQSGGLLYSRERFTLDLPTTPATYLISRTTSDYNTSGLPMCGESNFDLTPAENYTEHPADPNDPNGIRPHLVNQSAPQSLCAQYDYSYYSQLLANITQSAGGSIDTKYDLTVNAEALSANSDVLVKRFDSHVSLEPNILWEFGQISGQYEKYLFLIDGDLVINNPDDINRLIQVDPGAFVMFVTSGDINISSLVGNTLPSTTSSLQGVYIASQNLTIENNTLLPDKQFIGEGSFIGCANVNLNRNLADTNATQPAEKFIYRPDFIWSAPKALSRPSLVWSEL